MGATSPIGIARIPHFDRNRAATLIRRACASESYPNRDMNKLIYNQHENKLLHNLRQC